MVVFCCVDAFCVFEFVGAGSFFVYCVRLLGYCYWGS